MAVRINRIASDLVPPFFRPNRPLLPPPSPTMLQTRPDLPRRAYSIAAILRGCRARRGRRLVLRPDAQPDDDRKHRQDPGHATLVSICHARQDSAHRGIREQPDERDRDRRDFDGSWSPSKGEQEEDACGEA